MFFESGIPVATEDQTPQLSKDPSVPSFTGTYKKISFSYEKSSGKKLPNDNADDLETTDTKNDPVSDPRKLNFDAEQLAELEEVSKMLLDSFNEQGLQDFIDSLDEGEGFRLILDDSANRTLQPDQEIDIYQEISDYLERLKENDQRYYQTLNLVAKQLPPMTDATDLTVCIPVAAHEENDFILHALKSYTKQSLPNEQFEIVLFLNHPDSLTEEQHAKVRATKNAVEAFIASSDLNISFCHASMSNTNVNISELRGVLCDLTSLRFKQRGDLGKDLVVLSNDSDPFGISTNYLGSFVDFYAQNPDYISASGSLKWSPYDCYHHPALMVNVFLEDLISRWYDLHNPKVGGIGGANSSFLLSALCIAGGYTAGVRSGEDLVMNWDLGELAKDIGKKSRGFVGFHSQLSTSGRRAAQSIDHHHSLSEQWSLDSTRFSEQNSHIRIRNQIDHDLFSSRIHAPEFLKQLEIIINRTFARDEYWSGVMPKSEYVIDKFMSSFLKIDYVYTGKKSIQIIEQDLAKVEKRLLALRKQMISKWEKETGFDFLKFAQES